MEAQETINQENVTEQEQPTTTQTTAEKLQEMYKQMQSEIKEYVDEVNKLDSIEELEEKEKELFKLMDENDERVKNTVYKLQDAVVFNGKVYTKSALAKFINEQFDKLEINWQMTLGVFQLYDFWKNVGNEISYVGNEISYAVLDSTLRTLQQLKFKGYTDMRNILIINEFFKFNHVEYTMDLAKTTMLAEKHNALVDRLKLISKTDTPENIIAEEELKETMKKGGNK